MAGLLCLCGCGMCDCTAPSENIVEIYPPNELKRAIDKKTELVDLRSEKLEYWYCQECKRITVIERTTGHYARSYARKQECPAPPFTEVSSWQELLFWRDREFYDGIEEDERRTVADFVQKHPSRYLIRLSPDEKRALVFSPVTKEYLFSYLQDPTPVFVKERGEETSRLLARDST